MYPKKLKLDNLGTLQLTQTWHKYGTCPQGTIPVRRIGKDYPSTLLCKHRHPELSHFKASPNTLQPKDIRDGHEPVMEMISILLKLDGRAITIEIFAPTSIVLALCTHPQKSLLVAIFRKYPLSEETKKMKLSVYTRTKIVEIGGYKYKIFSWVIIQVLYSPSYQIPQQE
ncbi:hypothetical protein MKW98_005616 [Papaver atlanticum]|uniref:Uncharacterized protein n=1 Tax=Papaver atlanticum TaxID=357466 RepID=A0AAD4XIK6_9MAGN|nr:hypothetical protein MKW98_005616 [Papaver atlanticum]